MMKLDAEIYRNRFTPVSFLAITASGGISQHSLRQCKYKNVFRLHVKDWGFRISHAGGWGCVLRHRRMMDSAFQRKVQG